jgi:uncharacterized protein (TIGR03067 family)
VTAKLLSAVLVLTAGAPAPKYKPVGLDMTGEWEITTYVLGGKEAPPGVHVRFASDGTATFFGGPPAATHVGSYTLNVKRSPAELDIQFPSSTAGAMIGIVKRDGENLLICFGPADSRPTKFESPDGSGVGLLTLKSVKPKE